MEELFPGFDFQSVAELKRMGSLRGGLRAPDPNSEEELARLSLVEKEL
jgi:hypothetical protein